MQINIEQVKAEFSALTKEQMLEQWSRLHAGDKEAIPQTHQLTEAWLNFHNGNFFEAAEMAKELDGGKHLELKAQSTFAHYLEQDAEQKIQQFQRIAQRCETVLAEESRATANVHYQLAYTLGRYGQFISVAKALAEGIAGKIDHALNQCLTLEPEHADAHTALATYQAEIIGKLGNIAAKLTYGANTDSAISLYEKGITLAPFSVSAKTEYADGLISMFGKRQRNKAIEIYKESVKEAPIDALEAMDSLLARAELAEV